MSPQAVRLVPIDGEQARWDHPSTITTTTASAMYTGTLGDTGTTTQVSASSPPLSPDGGLAWLRLRERRSNRGGAAGHYSPASHSPSPTKLAPIVDTQQCRDAQVRRPPVRQGLSYFLAGGTPTALEDDCMSQIRAAIVAADSGATIIDSHKLIAERAADLHAVGTAAADLWQEDAHVRLVLGETVSAATSADVVVLYVYADHVPSNVAVQMYAARAAGQMILVVATDPSAREDWVIRAHSDRIFQTIEELSEYLVEQQSGKDWKGLRRSWRPARHAV
jgi:hypothetical protein